MLGYLAAGLSPSSNVLESTNSNYVSMKDVGEGWGVLGSIYAVGPVRKSGYQSPENLQAYQYTTLVESEDNTFLTDRPD
jgi:hypothetical protein